MKLFIVSSVNKRMENGEPACLAGKSGIEIVREIVEETKGQELQTEPKDRFGRSREYWIGWAAAYYQWYSGRKYRDILVWNDQSRITPALLAYIQTPIYPQSFHKPCHHHMDSRRGPLRCRQYGHPAVP